MQKSLGTLRSPRSSVALIVAALTTLFASPARTMAQSAAAANNGRTVACMDTLSLADSRPWIAYVHAITPDSSSRTFQSVADEFAQSVTQHMRVLLHARGDTLPAGEPAVGWRDFPLAPALRVTLSRGQPPRFDLSPALRNSPAALLLFRAATESQASDDAMFWTDDMGADSAHFALGYALSADGKVSSMAGVRYAFPAFSILRPTETPAKVIQMPDVPYPAEAFRAGGIGTVMVRFQVDTTGHVVPTTIREEWPPSQPRPQGQLLSIYTDFLQSVISALPSATFEPARVGTCFVSQWIVQPYSFSIKQNLIVR